MVTTRTPDAVPAVHRVADMQLRGADGLVPARVYWPAPADIRPPLLVAFGSSEQTLRALCMTAGVVVLAASHRSDGADRTDGTSAMDWAADHAAELDADPGCLFICGEGAGANLASAAVLHARDNGWPPIISQLLIFRGHGIAHVPALPTVDAAPATVVTVGGEAGEYQGQRYAFRLRLGRVPVLHLHYESRAEAAERMLADLADAIRRAVLQTAAPASDEFRRLPTS